LLEYGKENYSMAIKLLLLKSGENIIADVKELVSEEKVHGYLLINPQKLIVGQQFLLQETETENTQSDVKISMSPWMFLSSESEIVIRTDWIVTIVEAIESITKMYKEKCVNEDDQSNSVNK
jgi:hypothetical protein